MKSKNIICLIAALILINARSKGQTALIDSLLYWEKEVMMAENSERTFSALMGKSLIYGKIGQHQEAFQTLGRIGTKGLDSAKLCTLLYQKAWVCLMLKEYGSALSFSNDYAQSCPLDSNKLFMRQILLLENGLLGELERGPAHPQKEEHYLKLAKWLPGLGLIATGHKRAGYTNMALCASFLSFAVFNIYTGFYATALFSGINPMIRFYKGGKVLTERKLEEDEQKIADQRKLAGYQFLYKKYAY